jgi:hypothetical protein
MSSHDTRWLRDKKVMRYLTAHEPNVVTAVLYLGETDLTKHYVNIEDFLCDIPQYLKLLEQNF